MCVLVGWCANLLLCRCVGVLLSGCVGVWACVCVNMCYVCGCVVVWAYGCVYVDDCGMYVCVVYVRACAVVCGYIYI